MSNDKVEIQQIQFERLTLTNDEIISSLSQLEDTSILDDYLSKNIEPE